MEVIKFSLNKQKISLIDCPIIASNSKGYLYASFELESDDWVKPIIAIFISEEKVPFSVTLDDNNMCKVPWEVLQYGNKVEVSAVCGDLHTATSVTFSFENSGYRNGNEPLEPTPTVWSELSKKIDSKQDKLIAGSITADNIANKAVTMEKLADDVTHQFSKLKDALAEFYKPVSVLDNRKDVDLFISDSYGNVLATFKDGEFITKEFSTVKSIGNNICDTLEECDLAISDVQGNVVFCIVDGNIITPKYNAKNHYKTFSILGDSYSTFKDYTDPLNNTQWYPPSDSATQGSENDVEDVENTWWHLFANDYKSLLIQNNSYSGSCISYDSYGTGTVDGKNFSFVKRCENLKKAELIIIEGGTNDAWSNVSLGEYKYSNWVESDFETFRPACSYVLDYIKRNNIGAKIIFVLNDGLKSSITESIKNICNYYNVDVLELSNIKKSNNHPNIEGMKQIKEQLINFLLRGDFNG